MKSIPLGIENFELLRHNCYYVDHTCLIENVQRAAPTTAILILRPRRFGKSLALSMLQSFYEASPEKKRTLFGDLEVGKNKTLMEMEPKPTITLKLKDIKSPTYESFLNDFAFYDHHRISLIPAERSVRLDDDVLVGDCIKFNLEVVT